MRFYDWLVWMIPAGGKTGEFAEAVQRDYRNGYLVDKTVPAIRHYCYGFGGDIRELFDYVYGCYRWSKLGY